MLTAGPEPHYLLETGRHRRSLWAAVLAGLFAALSAAMLLCRSPQTSISQMVVVLLAGAYLTAAAIFGATGSYVFWRRSYARSAPGVVELLQSTVRGWYWIPAIVLLFRKDSAFAPAVAAAGAAILAFSLRREGPAALTPNPLSAAEPLGQTLFAQSLRTTRAEWSGPIIAISLYAAVLVLLRGWLFLACTFLALAAFIFAWNRTPAPRSVQYRIPYRLKISAIDLRQFRSAIPALIVTILAMLAGAGHDLHLWGMGLGHGRAAELPKIQHPPISNGLSGHLSIILLTAPQKQQFLAPQPTQPLLQGNRLNKPLVLQFDGEYWYFQPPDHGPGPGAYIAHESPLVANVHSVLAIPLLMQAHQRLGSPLPLTCCHAIEVELENRDRNPGALDLTMSLSDSATPGKSVLLGLQHIQSSEGSLWQSRSTPAHETLRFELPMQGEIRQFDQVDMLIIPSPARMQSGAKIAIRTLRLIP